MTMISFKSGLTGMTGKKSMPKEGILKEYALRRMSEAQMKEIDSHLSKLRKTDDLSYSNTGEKGEQNIDSKGQRMVDEETLL